MENQEYSPGLEGIVAGITKISHIDPGEPQLIYRGYRIADLAEHSSFEETAYLLLHGKLPSKAELEAFDQELKANREVPQEFYDLLKAAPKDVHPMDILRTGVSVLGLSDPDRNDDSPEANLRKATRIIAKFPTIAANGYRITQGKDPVAPDISLSHAANFLYMLTGEKPDKDDAKVLDTTLILYADHGFNASTFSSRVTISTLSDIHSAITSAVGTLKGPLHGGANQKALEMLQEVGDPAKAEQFVKDKLAAHELIMGFGHRVYKTADTRTPIMKQLSKYLAEKNGDSKWFDISENIEKTVKEEKGLPANVDFYCGSVYHSLGLPKEVFTTLFAVARVAGWSSHVMEQLEKNRLIRPTSIYEGKDGLTYVPINERS